jgi:hypothetical protein
MSPGRWWWQTVSLENICSRPEVIKSTACRKQMLLTTEATDSKFFYGDY